IKIAADHVRRGLQEMVECLDFAGQDEAQMALGDHQLGVAGDSAKAGNACGRKSVKEHTLMLGGGDSVEDGSGNAYARTPIGKACDEGGYGLGLPVGVHNEDDGKVEQLGEVGGGAETIC